MYIDVYCAYNPFTPHYVYKLQLPLIVQSGIKTAHHIVC